MLLPSLFRVSLSSAVEKKTNVGLIWPPIWINIRASNPPSMPPSRIQSPSLRPPTFLFIERVAGRCVQRHLFRGNLGDFSVVAGTDGRGPQSHRHAVVASSEHTGSKQTRQEPSFPLWHHLCQPFQDFIVEDGSDNERDPQEASFQHALQRKAPSTSLLRLEGDDPIMAAQPSPQFRTRVEWLPSHRGLFAIVVVAFPVP